MPATDTRTKAQLLAALRDMKRQAEDQRADLEEREARMEKKLDRAMSSLAARDPPALVSTRNVSPCIARETIYMTNRCRVVPCLS